jgi:uncharacterized protein (TIGR03067 family)
MKSVLPASLILTLFLALAASQPPADVLRAEVARHQGLWAVTSFVREGKETPPEVARTIVREVTGDHVVWKRAGKSFAGTTVVLDPSKTPHAIDVIPDGGRDRDKHVLGIYKLEGDTLTIGMADPDRPRPAGFEAPAGNGLTLMTFQRVP